MASIQDLDTRQRMINMMYIIFISMLALNMSKKVLDAFGDVNSSLKNNIEQTSKRNTSLMAGLAQKAQDQPEKYKPLQEKALGISTASKDLVSYIDKIKKDLVKGIERDEKGNLKYRQMDSDWMINNMFFANDKVSKRAKGIVTRINTYRDKTTSMADAMGNVKLKKAIATKFDTQPVKSNNGGKEPWIRKEFEGFPLIAAITKLSNLQSNVKQVQSELLTNLVSGQLESDVSMTNYQAIVIPSKTAFFANENFKGKVVLGRFDNTLNFKNVSINGQKVTDIEGGQVVLDFPAGNVGDHDIKGKLQFEEGDSTVSIPVKSSYTVIPMPNSAVISADKMNVVYRGVKNPMTISIPGVPSINAQAPGLSHVKGSKYVMVPTNIKGHKVTIKASGTLPNGKTVSPPGKTFRIKDIPSPKGAIRGQVPKGGPIKMQRRDLKISRVSAMLPDFDFDLKLNVSGFKVKVPGKPIIPVHGTALNSAAKRAIGSAKRGSMVQIVDIKAHISGNSTYHLQPVSPVIIQLTN